MNILQSMQIIDRAIDQYTPSHVFAMFSGGYDSLVTAHITAQHPQFSGCVHINTKTGIPETHDFVVDTCKEQGWPLLEYTSDERDSFEAWVLAGGFPGPSQHNVMFNRLKDRGIAKLIREHKRSRLDKIMLVAGVRQQESQRRMGTAHEVRVDKARLWVNPIFSWSKRDVLDYKRQHLLPTNMVVQNLHMSGECLCGAFAKPGELALIEAFYPEVGARIRALEAQVQAAGYPWGWEQGPPDWYKQVKRGQEMFNDFAPLCSSCEWKAAA